MWRSIFTAFLYSTWIIIRFQKNENNPMYSSCCIFYSGKNSLDICTYQYLGTHENCSKWNTTLLNYSCLNNICFVLLCCIKVVLFYVDISAQCAVHICFPICNGTKEYIFVRKWTAPPCVFQTFAHPTSPHACSVRQSGSWSIP